MQPENPPLRSNEAIGAQPPPTPGRTGCTADARSLRRVASQELFRGERQLEIEHGSVLYRLQITALGKLILTK